MSSRESQRLLSLLNASFKQELDRKYLADSKSNEHYANLHLQSVLTNPLFDAKPRTCIDFNKNQNHGKRAEQVQDHGKRPMDAFKERVSQGIADLRTAKFFLYKQYKECLDSPAATPREAMQSSGAASTILQWLWSSGVEDTGDFLRDRAFIFHLVPFLVADGQHSRILHWLHRCYSPEKTAFSSSQSLKTDTLPTFLFRELIAAEIRFGGGMESAITLFTRTVADFWSSGSTKTSTPGHALSAALVLTQAIIGPKAAEPGPGMFQRFMETTSKLTFDDPTILKLIRTGLKAKVFQKDQDFLNAYLGVHVQKPPNPHPALRYFQDRSKVILKMSNSQQHDVILLGLKAAKLFLQDGSQTEALWIMNFLETNFGQELGRPSLRTRKIRRRCLGPVELLRREEQSLHLLDTLTA